MTRCNHVTATAQGIISYDKNGKALMQRYDASYQSQTDNRPKHIKRTQEEIEKLHLNMIQRQMFRRLMYGLTEYQPEQIAVMSPQIISKIVDDYKKAKRAIHVLKARKYFEPENKLINAMAPHVKAGDKDFDWFMEIPKEVTLRKLGITTVEVITEFIKRRLLPKDFFNLNPQNVLPC